MTDHLPRIEVIIPDALREYADGETTLPVRAADVRAALDVLQDAHPELTQRILTRGGELRKFVNVYKNEEDIRTLDGLDTRLRDGQALYILPSVAGG